MPNALIDQLKNNGRLIIPLGMSGFHQELMQVVKEGDAKIHTEYVLDVAFSPWLMMSMPI